MFDIGFGEILVTFGVGVALIGRKDLPVFARAAGRQLGRAVAYVRRSRDELGSKLDKSVDRSDLQQVQAELNKTMMELDAIKREVYSAGKLSPDDLIAPKLSRPTQSFTDASDASKEGAVPKKVLQQDMQERNHLVPNVISRVHSPSDNLGVQKAGSSLLTEVYLDEWESENKKN